MIFIPNYSEEIQPVHPKGDQSWVFIGRTDVEAETPILWPPDLKIWLIWKAPDVGKDWGQEEKGMIEDEIVGWYHWLNGYGFGWTLGVGDRQERPGVLWFMGSQRVRHNWVTELNWTVPMVLLFVFIFFFPSYPPRLSVFKFFICVELLKADLIWLS